jgi:putative DNA methylase
MALGLAVSRSANTLNSLVIWSVGREQSVNLFSRQAIPMSWDFPEVNPFAGAAGDFGLTTHSMARCIEAAPASVAGHVTQNDAQAQTLTFGKVVSTDPPYYDNVAYADLSDFFYVWLRAALRDTFPDLFATIAVPKAEELVAASYRHGSGEKAEAFFLAGMTETMHRLAEQANPAFPVTIYYAFKQSETNVESGTVSAGWETFLDAVLRAGFAISGTWPMRTERPTGVKVGTNALASSIILVCRQRPHDAATVSRREFVRELNAALPEALDEMTRGGVNSPVAPVDLSQAIIGPGMAIFSRYKAVLEADGRPMSVRTALTLINRFFAEDDFDHDTQFCLHWFDNSGWAIGKFGEADVLARAKGTAVNGLVQTGVVESSGGNLRLFRWAEYPADWAPESDRQASIWEALHQLIRALKQQGDSAAGGLLARMPEKAEPIRALAYRLYTLCDRKSWAEDARAYNELITSWSGIEAASHNTGHTGTQAKLEL